MSILTQIFTWWNGQTLGTRFLTWRRGQKVGEDEAGNIYYQNRDGSRRWVIYNGESEASRISPEWHGWLHHTWQEPPTVRPWQPKPWEKPHNPNLSGSPAAYRPQGSILLEEPRNFRDDYEPWTPA